METYRQTARLRSQRQNEQVAKRYKRAWKVAQAGSQLLKSKFGARHVAVFGSLLTSPQFHHRSDIDLAVWGLPKDLYFRAVASLQTLDEQISIDLVEFETASSRLQQKIEVDGKQI